MPKIKLKLNEFNPLIQVIVVILSVWAIVHAIQTRTKEDFWRYSLSIAMIIGMIMLFVAIGTWFTERPKISVGEALAILIVALIAIVFASAFYYAIGASIKDLFFWIRDIDTLYLKAISASLLVLIAGSLLFYFRLRFRSIYGVTEAFVGIAVAMQQTISTPTGSHALTLEQFLPLLTASVYLVVRGFDNVHQGLTKDPLDLAAKTVLAWVRLRSQFPQKSHPPNID
jgi:hypothetical protein